MGDERVSLAIVVTWKTGTVVEISPHGEIDVDSAHEVREAVVEVLTQHRPARVEVNLSAVAFIDSTGISAMVAGFQMAEVTGAKLVVTRPSPFVHRQLWVTGLLGLFGAPPPYEPGVPGRDGRATPRPERARGAVG
jgi:anti-anti-sigma factor